MKLSNEPTPPGTRYKVLADGWFVEGTYATLVADCAQGGVIMAGERRCEHEESEGRPVGIIYHDEELCAREEFEDLLDWNWPL